MVKYRQWQTFFKIAAKRLTLERKTIRTLLKGLHISYSEIQTKYKSDHSKLRYRRFSFCMVKYSQWQTFFKMAAKRLTLARKTIRTLLKGLHVSYTEIQTKCKSDQYKLRYRRFYVFSMTVMAAIFNGRHLAAIFNGHHFCVLHGYSSDSPSQKLMNNLTYDHRKWHISIKKGI